MVQLLNAKPTFASRFTEKFNPSFQQGLNRFLEESAEENREQRRSLLDQEKEARQLKQQEANAEALGLPKAAINPTVQSALLKEQAKDKRNQQLMDLLGTGNQNGEPSSERQGFQSENLSDEDIAAISLLNPNLANIFQKQQKTSQSTKEFAHRETSKYAEKVAQDSERAREIIDAANEIEKITKKEGAVGVNARNLAFTYLKGKESPFANLFQSEDTQALISATKTLAGGGIKEIFNRPTEREFFWFENILPDILKDAPTNQKAANYFKKVANISLRKQEIFDDIVKKNKGYRPIDIDSQVRSKIAPEMKKLVEEGEKLKEGQYNLKALPEASKYQGKIAEDDEGNRFRSNGTIWEPL